MLREQVLIICQKPCYKLDANNIRERVVFKLRFAYRKGVDYVPFLTDLCFAGTQASFELSVVKATL